MDILPLSDFKGNHVTKLHIIFSFETVKIGCLFCLQREDNHGKDKRRYLWAEEVQQVQAAQVLEAEQVLGGLYKEPRGTKESSWR